MCAMATEEVPITRRDTTVGYDAIGGYYRPAGVREPHHPPTGLNQEPSHPRSGSSLSVQGLELSVRMSHSGVADTTTEAPTLPATVR